MLASPRYQNVYGNLAFFFRHFKCQNCNSFQEARPLTSHWIPKVVPRPPYPRHDRCANILCSQFPLMLECSMTPRYYILFQGRIHQIEYAMEAVKQGSAAVGLKSKTHAILVALKVTNSYSLWLSLRSQNYHYFEIDEAFWSVLYQCLVCMGCNYTSMLEISPF